MTLYGAIIDLVMMREHPMMPSMFYSSLDKIIETVSECEEPERKKGKWIPRKSIFGGLDEKVYTCDQCGCNIGFHTENFCPRCGSYNGGEER